MKHKHMIALAISLLCLAFIALCVLIAVPAGAYDGDPIRTARQDALHEAADLLRAAGSTG